MRTYNDIFESIINVTNLFSAWDGFKKGKMSRIDVLEFEWNLEKEIFALHHELKEGLYRHAPYTQFFIYDPKLRHIYKAVVRDRILHHAIVYILNPLFEPTFIATSFSCRVEKGNHRGVEIVTSMLRKESRNNTRMCFALKCDIQKFFDTIGHDKLISIISKRIKDVRTMELLVGLIGSYETKVRFEREREYGRFAPKRYTHRKSYFPTLCKYLYE